MISPSCQVAIIGAGPSGLSAAIRLKQLGVSSVIIIEREAQAGGIPRHCGHSPFGMREFHQVLSGANYAGKLVNQAVNLGVEICLNTSVTQCAADGVLVLSSLDGVMRLQAEKIIICTGNRETPRSARLVSGSRPMGIFTTGALQSMVYLKGRRPFKRPVIVGTELIAFSALLTCRHAKIKPVAMIEANNRVTIWKAAALLPRLMGVPMHMNTAIESIHGKDKVEAIEIKNNADEVRLIDCDGVIFSGQFVSESSLIRASHLQHDSRSGGPMVDQYNRCSDPDYFACGNILHPVDTAGWCWAEGHRVAGFVSAELHGQIPKTDRHVKIESSCADIKYFTPQKIALADKGNNAIASDKLTSGEKAPALQIRFNTYGKGQLSLSDENTRLCTKSVRVMPEKRHLLTLPDSGCIEKSKILSLQFNS